MATPFDYFQMEAVERLERLSSGLVQLDQSPDDEARIGDLFREAHSLKGAAGVAGLTDISDICHKMEDLLGGVRDGTSNVSSAMIDALLSAADAVGELVSDKLKDQESRIEPKEVIQRLENLDLQVAATASEESEARPIVTPQTSEQGIPASPPDSVRLRLDLLQSLGNRTGQLMVAGDRLRQRLGLVRDLHALVRSTHKLHHTNQQMEHVLRPIEAGIHQLVTEFTSDFTVLEPLITEIHEEVLETRMLPLSVLFDQLPRFVREYCRQEDKEAELLVEGAGARVDRQILEQLRDPIIHLVRNALSHGIEPAQQRAKAGKPPSGTMRLITSRHGDRMRITCEDDGRGIDREQVLTKAVSKGMLSEAEAAELPVAQVDRLILRPGFSTTEAITDVSGRGVGLDVVLSRISALRGSIEIESEPGAFTRFVLEFSASMATLEGLLVESAGHTYVLPTNVVVATERVMPSDLRIGAGGESLMIVGGRAVRLLMLSSLLGLPAPRTDPMVPKPVVILRCRDSEIALGVDRLLGIQTIVGKGLGDHIGSVSGVAAAAILGTGLPALILDPLQLVRTGCGRVTEAEDPVLSPEVQQPLSPLLVVDDSITTRMMEQSILESAGYHVDTAVSAEDALAKVEQRTYGLFVLDVEMPGLNGFQLTRKLRQDERFAETPIIIVSSLARQDHRLEGLEAGANAYIVKGEFDQNNLLETVGGLVGS